jgi:hypothetical protein
MKIFYNLKYNIGEDRKRESWFWPAHINQNLWLFL